MKKTIAHNIVENNHLDASEIKTLCAFNENLVSVKEDKFRGVKIFIFKDKSKVEIGPFQYKEIL